MRRVVTGHNKEGKAIVAIDGHAPRVIELPNYPGYAMHEIWSTGKEPRLPFRGEDPTLKMSHFIPASGETRFSIMQVPPLSEIQELVKSGTIDIGQAFAEFADAMPDMGKTMEPDNSGMHTTDSIDYIVVLSGEIWCELDDGDEVHLTPGESLIQCGTRHAWTNKGNEPCTMAAVMIGATRR
ncbi:MAG: cupin domain-containing protein [Anaerolineales bacterium]|nr:cupin domain-containing protein [Anaerolineales bacterium]